MSGVNDAFERLLPVVESDLRTILEAPPNFPSMYYDMLHYHMGWQDENGQPLKDGLGGKRIRPVVCMLISEAVCGDGNPARPAACAVELIHNFSLLHDDIQDRSPLRRSRPTAWSIWGEAQAINAGDALFALAHLAVPRLGNGLLEPDIIVTLLEIIGNTNLELTRGQHLDMAFEERSDVTSDEYLNMIAGKTAALLDASTRMGAICGGASPEQQEQYASFGTHVGLAFQIQDDILDIWGDPERTGKKAAIDIHQRKKSYPVLYGLERSEALREIYADDESFSDETVDHIKMLLKNTGALDSAKELVETYSSRAVSSLEAASPRDQPGDILLGLVNMLIKRDR